MDTTHCPKLNENELYEKACSRLLNNFTTDIVYTIIFIYNVEKCDHNRCGLGIKPHIILSYIDLNLRKHRMWCDDISLYRYIRSLLTTD